MLIIVPGNIFRKHCLELYTRHFIVMYFDSDYVHGNLIVNVMNVSVNVQMQRYHRSQKSVIWLLSG